ncbi:MAG TPA: HlyD family efflux transporter periplasmic adaptor subunit [Gemmatimonadaceae bacterium]|nr:HlyD family efflux transporter periplasmic adaptor subunit [Gemmatimonadaceae bacterium]
MDIKREPPKKRGKYIMIGVGVAVLGITTVALGNLEQRAPSVDRATLWIDSVSRGTMTRQVRAPGTLTPEHIRYVVAVTSGRVEQLPVRPGVTVTPETVILELSNPDVQLEMLNAQSAVTSAQQNYVTLQTSLESQRLQQETGVANARTFYGTAKRDFETFKALDEKKLASPMEVARSKDAMDEAQKRLDSEEKRLKVTSGAIEEQLKLARANIDRLNAILRFQLERVGSMKVLAGESGQLLSLGNGQQELQLGQWVLAGGTLATVAQPGKLKAVLRVPETQAKDVALGQKVDIDTRAGGGGANSGIVKGHVSRVDPTSVNGTVTVEVLFDQAAPSNARADLSVDGVIEIERLDNVLYVQRPAYGQAESTVGLFKLDPDGKTASRVNVKLGRSSVSTIEIVSGLQPKDKVIVSDMSQWDNVAKVRLQ